MSDDLLTPDEHKAIEMAGALWTHIVRHVVGNGPSQDGDLRELVIHIHGIQQFVMSNAAGRAYPERYRLLGESVSTTKQINDEVNE